MKKKMELNLGIILPFPLFSCQGGNVWNRKLNGPQVMVSSYLADTEVYLVWPWKKGAGAYGFHTWELSGHLSPPTQLPDGKHSKCKLIKVVHTNLLHWSSVCVLLEGRCKWQQSLAMKQYLTLTERLQVWNQKPLHNVKYYHHFTEREVDSEVKWLIL